MSLFHSEFILIVVLLCGVFVLVSGVCASFLVWWWGVSCGGGVVVVGGGGAGGVCRCRGCGVRCCGGGVRHLTMGQIEMFGW